MMTRLRRRFAWWLLSFDHAPRHVVIPFMQALPEFPTTRTTTLREGQAVFVYSGQKVPCA